MRRSHPGLHPVVFRIERTKAHGTLEMRNGVVGLSEPDPQKSAEKPGRRQIGIEHHSPVEQGNAGIEIAAEMRERMAATGQRHRVVPAEFDTASRQPGALGNLADRIGHPSVDLAPEVAPVGHPAQIVVVGVEVFGSLAFRPLDLRALELRRDVADDVGGDLILQFEDVVECAFETFRPKMRPGRGVDQLPGDTHAVRRLAHAAFQHVTHAEFAADLLHVDGAALVGEARVAGDDEQPAIMRQRGDDVLHHAIGEIFLFRIAAQVLEGQHGDRWLVGKGRRRRGFRLGDLRCG